MGFLTIDLTNIFISMFFKQISIFTFLLIYVTLWVNGLSPFRLLFAALSEFCNWTIHLNNKVTEEHERELRARQNERENQQAILHTQVASAAAASCRTESLAMLPHDLVHPHVVNTQGVDSTLQVLTCNLLGSDSHIGHCDLRVLKTARPKKGSSS